MAPRSVANPVPASTDNAITPDLAMILHDAKPHPQLGAPAPQPPSTARGAVDGIYVVVEVVG
jgi:hypothetical protein